MNALSPWILGILADPITKLPVAPDAIGLTGSGIVDARRYLPNTPGFRGWIDGQEFYESWHETQSDRVKLQAELDGVRPVYDHVRMTGRILDVGGHLGLVREFLPDSAEFVAVDPFIDVQQHVNEAQRAVYRCLSRPLNFIGACAEFLPFTARSFDWVHMRSMLDHVQSVDLALMEARRVLKPGGRLVIGLWLHGGRSGRMHLQPKQLVKETVRRLLGLIGVNKYRDHHIFHPTYADLERILRQHGFTIVDTYWQPQWQGQVAYVTATPVG